MTRAALAVALSVAAASTGGRVGAQTPGEAREVRQIVTFRFLPGQLPAVMDVYRSQVVPAYRETEAMRMVRFLDEVESPEPLDLVVVTHVADMAGMDRANRQLTSRTSDGGPTIGQLYRQIADLSLGHHDQFVELISPPAVAPTPDRTLDVLEFVRVSPGAGPAWERQVLSAIHPWELDTPVHDLVVRSETARVLVGDSWDYLRTYAVRDLAAWQSYVTARNRHPAAYSADRFVVARKTLILREIADLRVR